MKAIPLKRSKSILSLLPALLLLSNNGYSNDKNSLLTETASYSSPERDVLAVTKPAVFLTPFALKFAIDQLISSLEARAKNVIGEGSSQIQETIAQLKSTSEFIVDKFHGRMNESLEHLSTIERKTFEDAEHTLKLVEKSADNLARVSNNINRSVQDLNILSYDLLNIFKKNKVTRIVYYFPAEIVANGNDQIVTVRGNFSNVYNHYFQIGGTTLEPKSLTNNEMVIEVPDKFLSSLESNKNLTVKVVSVETEKGFLSCKCEKIVSEQSVTVVAKPKTRIEIISTINPLAELPSYKGFLFEFKKEDDNCSCNYPVEKIFTLDPGYEVVDFNLYPKRTFGRSSISKPYRVGESSIKVDARLAGRQGFLGICESRGKLKYLLGVRGKTYNENPLSEYKDVKSSNGETQTSFFVEYPGQNIPSDHRRIKWQYNVEVKITQGKTTQTYQLSDVNPSHKDIKTSIVNGRLSIELNSDYLALR